MHDGSMFEANINIHYFTASPSHLYKPHEPRVGLFGGSVVLPRQKRGCFSGGRAAPRLTLMRGWLSTRRTVLTKATL